MRNNCEYDEKQMFDRGIVYRYAFVIALITNLLLYFAKDGFDVKMTPYCETVLCVWIPVTICVIMLIRKDAYDGMNSGKGCNVISLIGCTGAILIVTNAIRIATGKRTFIVQGMFTDDTAYMISGVCMLSICVVYWAKRLYDRKHGLEIEE